MPRHVALIVVSFVLAAPVGSQDKKPPEKKDAPKVLYAVPLVARPGETQKLALRGKNLAAVREVTVGGADGAKVKVLGAKAVPVPNNYSADRVGDSEVEVELELPKGAKPGAVTLTAAGSNAYALLVRDDTPAVAEKEPNDGFDQAQPVPVPSAVEGTVRQERDPDVYRFAGKKGDRVRVEVRAARHGSPADPRVVVYDADRRVLDSADDTDGTADPVLVVALPRDGTYFVAVTDANDLGGANFGYRLVVRPEG
ncbi:MAG: hypothetical protein C0501_14845 [Isosphaera sp.]|nr:hypothetical protein [Isosphaera sp.]